MTAMPVLSVENLDIFFGAPGRKPGKNPSAHPGKSLHVVRDLSFSVSAGETLAIVGESGCGKSLTALALLGLVPPPGRVEGRAIRLEGRDLLQLHGDAMRMLRGARIAMIFQEPMTALNPVLTVGEQISEAILEHEAVSARAAHGRALELLRRVRIADPERRFHDHPHQLSGGMRQRVMIAMALACSPAVLVADEPTTALDVTVQAQILGLIAELKAETGMAVVFITHDLGLVARHADRVLVMYAGRKVEEQPAASLFAAPLHPYTRGLIAARPSLNGGGADVRRRLAEIPGVVPAPDAMPPGCAFAPRCAEAIPACTQDPPQLTGQEGRALVACIRTGTGAAHAAA